MQYSYNTPSISDRLAILVVPPNHSITYTANFADITFAVTPNVVLPDRTPITNTATISSSVGQVVTREITSLYGAPDFSTSYKRVVQSIFVQPSDTVQYEVHVINNGPVDGSPATGRCRAAGTAAVLLVGQFRLSVRARDGYEWRRRTGPVWFRR